MMQWSPHPMHRAGPLAAGLVVLACGAFGLWGSLTGRIWPSGVLGDLVSGAVLVVVLLVALLPRGNRRARGLYLLLLIALAAGVQILIATTWRVPPVGLVGSTTLLVAGLGLVVTSQARRRNLQITLEAGRILVRAKRQEIEHELPLASIQEVDVRRNPWSRLWGYATLVVHARKADLGQLIDRPLVSEEAAAQALMGNGWDDEGRFLLKAAHPYRTLRRRLEDQIRIARLPPKEREEAELAQRLGEDLENIHL